MFKGLLNILNGNLSAHVSERGLVIVISSEKILRAIVVK
jgi:hypothetical protein